MKNIFIASIFVCYLLASCNQNNNIIEKKITIKTSEFIGLDSNQTKNITISDINTEYFEIGLYKVSSSNGYIASKELISPKVGVQFHSKDFVIVDSTNNFIVFNSSTDFLNFMIERNYEMVNKTNVNSDFEFTFKRKNNK